MGWLNADDAECGVPPDNPWEPDHVRLLRARVRELARSKFESQRDATDAAADAAKLMPVLGEHGLLGTLISADHGGDGMGMLASAAVAEELGAVIPSLAAMRAISSTFVGRPLEVYGSPEQRERWLPPLIAGTSTTALAITEPGAGSDLGSLATVGRRVGDDWILNGRKHHISGAAEADVILLVARTEPDEPLDRALSIFLVPNGVPGLQLNDGIRYMGVRGLSHCEITLTDVHLPPDALVGEAGKGLAILECGLATERIDIAARALGCASRAFEEAKSHLASRHQFGSPLRRKQALSHRLADMRTALDAGRLLLARAAVVYDEVCTKRGPEEASRAASTQAAMAKLHCAREGYLICDEAMQMLGGLGYRSDSPVESMLRDCRVFRYGGGTDEIMRHIIQKSEYRSRSN